MTQIFKESKKSKKKKKKRKKKKTNIKIKKFIISLMHIIKEYKKKNNKKEN